MQMQTLGIIIGGLLPAILYGLSGVFTKASTRAGIGLGIYLMIIGCTVMLVGTVIFLFIPDKTASLRSALHAGGVGLTWGLGTGLVAIAMSKYALPLSKAVPLFNMNTLVVVILALWIFSEWQQVRVSQLLIGAIFIVIGGVLVARA
jgi:drug/metabolite transporter (DMT)-like permease